MDTEICGMLKGASARFSRKALFVIAALGAPFAATSAQATTSVFDLSLSSQADQLGLGGVGISYSSGCTANCAIQGIAFVAGSSFAGDTFSLIPTGTGFGNDNLLLSTSTSPTVANLSSNGVSFQILTGATPIYDVTLKELSVSFPAVDGFPAFNEVLQVEAYRAIVPVGNSQGGGAPIVQTGSVSAPSPIPGAGVLNLALLLGAGLLLKARRLAR